MIPKAALNQHIAILGKTGSGKTYAAKGIVEHLLDEKRQVCILDPTGAWWGMRLGSDGKKPGYDLVLLGGEHGDIPLAEKSAAAVARLVTQQGASVVCDTSGMTVGEYTRWFIEFAGTLYTTVRNPLHLVIDEAHYFMPQGKSPDVDAGRMLHAGNRLMSGGRSRGIRGLLITQRPAKLHKDSLTCADTLVAMRMLAPQDRGAVKDWIDGAGDPVKGKEILDSLASLDRGEGWVWYPEGGHLKRTRFGDIKTYDSSAAPKHGAKPPAVGEIKLDEVKAALADAVREAEANDPKRLRAEIARLQSEAKKAPPTAKAPAPVDVAAIERRVRDGVKKAFAPILRDLQKTAARIAEDQESLARGLGSFAAIVEAPQAEGTHVEHANASLSRPVREVHREGGGESDLQPRQIKILKALAEWEALGFASVSRAQCAFMAERSPSSSSYDNDCSALKTRGLVRYPGDGELGLTAAGSMIAGIMPAPQQAELHERVCGLLVPRQAKMLRALIQNQRLTRAQLAEDSGRSAGSSSYDNDISRLRTLGLVDYPESGVVELEEWLR